MGTRELIGIQIAQDARRANTVNIYTQRPDFTQVHSGASLGR